MSKRVCYSLSFSGVVLVVFSIYPRGVASTAPPIFSPPVPVLPITAPVLVPETLAGIQQIQTDEQAPIIRQGERLHIESLTEPGVYMDVPLEALRLVHPYARQSLFGMLVGQLARKYGKQQPSNRMFYRHPRIACAAYVTYVLRKAGWKHGSNGATALYGLTRKYGGRLVGTSISTKYVKYLAFLQSGDLIFFIQGGRIRHVEMFVGAGLTSGTSSSMGRVGIRGIGNRGFRLATVVRM